MSLPCCPNCGYKGSAGLTHCYFYVYKCGVRWTPLSRPR